MPDEAGVLERVLVVVSRNCPGGRPVGAEVDIVDSALVDSAGFMALFNELEDEFGLVVTAADLDLENFRAARRIARFVAAKKASLQSPPAQRPEDRAPQGD